MVTCKRSAAVVKKLRNYEHLAPSATKKQTQVSSGIHLLFAVHFVVAMENTSNPLCQLILLLLSFERVLLLSTAWPR